MDIGKIIYDRRKELGLTLEEVGNAVGVGKSTVRKWEQGMIQNIKRDKIELLSKVLKVSPLTFVKGELVKEDTIETDEDPITTSQLKFALFNGDKEITDDMLNEVLRFAEFVKQRENDKQNP